MLAGVTVEEVVSVMKNDKGTGKKDIEKALNHYGIGQAKTMTKADNFFILPQACMILPYISAPILIDCFRLLC